MLQSLLLMLALGFGPGRLAQRCLGLVRLFFGFDDDDSFFGRCSFDSFDSIFFCLTPRCEGQTLLIWEWPVASVLCAVAAEIENRQYRHKSSTQRNDGEHDRRRRRRLPLRPRAPAPPPVGTQRPSDSFRPFLLLASCRLSRRRSGIFRLRPFGTACVILRRHEPLGIPSTEVPARSGGGRRRHRPPAARGTVRSAPPPPAVAVDDGCLDLIVAGPRPPGIRELCSEEGPEETGRRQQRWREQQRCRSLL